MAMQQAQRHLDEDREIQQLLSVYLDLCPHEDGIWSCDVGAATLAWLSDQFGIERCLRSGLYWHLNAASYSASTGNEIDGDADEGVPEAHCWIEIERDYGPVLIDSNPQRLPGKARQCWLMSEDGKSLLDAHSGRWIGNPFEALNDLASDCVGFEPDEDIEELANDTSFSRDLADILAKGRQALLSA